MQQHADSASHLVEVAPDQQVAQQPYGAAEQSFVEVAPGGVDVHSLHEAVALLWELVVGVAFLHLVFDEACPLVHHGLAEESRLEGEALLGRETAV